MKTIISGVQPSGRLTLGNYLGAIKNFVTIQENENMMNFSFLLQTCMQ